MRSRHERLHYRPVEIHPSRTLRPLSIPLHGKFKGKLLVADAHPVVLEGEWPRDKVVIMEFPDDAAARDFQNSPEYQEISVDRKAGADAIVLTVRGLS